MKTIGFDLDGVLYDFHTACYNHLKMHHNLTEPFDTFWKDADSFYSENFFDNLIRVPILYEKINIKLDNLIVLTELNKKYNLVYITNRPNEVKFATEQWMKFNKIPQRSNLYFCVGSKINLVVKNNCEYYIDDRIRIVKELEPFTNSILLKKDWHGADELEQITHISSLKELLETKL